MITQEMGTDRKVWGSRESRQRRSPLFYTDGEDDLEAECSGLEDKRKWQKRYKGRKCIRTGVEILHPELRRALRPESRVKVFEKHRITLLTGNNVEK